MWCSCITISLSFFACKKSFHLMHIPPCPWALQNFSPLLLMKSSKSQNQLSAGLHTKSSAWISIPYHLCKEKRTAHLCETFASIPSLRSLHAHESQGVFTIKHRVFWSWILEERSARPFAFVWLPGKCFELAATLRILVLSITACYNHPHLTVSRLLFSGPQTQGRNTTIFLA